MSPSYHGIIFGLLYLVPTGNAMNAEERLFRLLLDENRYDKRARPVKNSCTPVNVSFRIDFNQLYEVSEKTQTITIMTDIYEQWYEHRLFWDAAEYENLTSIVVDSGLIWVPDTTLYNGIEMYRPSVEDVGKAIIIPMPDLNTSLVNYFYNGRHAIGCRLNIRYFPFDTQNCTFSFGSWSQDGAMLRYSLASTFVTTEYYQPHDAWWLLSFDMQVEDVKFDCCPYPFMLVNAHLVIKRRSLYYIFNLIIPTMVINILSTFALFASRGGPDNRHDKMDMGLTTLLSYCILLLSVSDQIPKGSSSVPLLGIFYVVIMLQHAIEMFVSVYLSFPRQRALFLSVCRSVWSGSSPCRLSASSKVKKIKPKGTSGDNGEKSQESKNFGGDNLEFLCMCTGVISTLVITAAFLAVGFSA